MQCKASANRDCNSCHAFVGIKAPIRGGKALATPTDCHYFADELIYSLPA